MPKIKAVRYWQRDRHIDQQNRIENPYIDSHKYSQLIFDKGIKPFNKGRIVFSINVAGIIGYHRQKYKPQRKCHALYRN